MTLKALLLTGATLLTLQHQVRGQQEIQLGPDTLGLDDTTAFKTVTISLMSQNLTPDMPIVRALDSVANIMFFQDNYLAPDNELHAFYQSPLEQTPYFADSVIARRIEELDRMSPFEMVYNQHVKDFIELYAVRKRALTSRVLGLGAIYFPMIEEMLDKYNMPLELKYLAVVESALNPTAVSRAGARGLWQFMYNTGKLYGLKANSMVDDRSDPYKATDAACRHLRDLYELYGSWSLALAAYNSGAGNVNKAIRRAGGIKDYWAIWPYLPRETRGYVPAFIAVNYVMHYSSEHNIYPLHPGILYGGIDTVEVHDVLSFDQISEFLGVPAEQVKFLNPAYKEEIIPASADKTYVLRLPREKVADFINNEKALYQYKTQKGIEREKLLAKIKSATERTVHIVRRGETLSSVAKKYHCRVSDLKKWNGLRKKYIRKGQRLVIFPAGNDKQIASKQTTPSESTKNTSQTHQGRDTTLTSNSTQIKTASAKTSDTVSIVNTTNQVRERTYQVHKVKKGQTLSAIAQLYNVSVASIKNLNSLKKSTIHVGQKLKIPSGDSAIKTNEYKYYTVKKGDTLFKIAESIAKMTVEELKKINSITTSTTLKIGQKLIIGFN